MGCFGGCGNSGAGYGMPSYGGTGFNFALIVVLFVLLIIIGVLVEEAALVTTKSCKLMPLPKK